MAIVFDENGKYVDEKGLVKLDPTKFADWQIAEEAEKSLPPSTTSVRSWACCPRRSSPTARPPRSTSSRL